VSDRPARTGDTPPFRRKASALAVELETLAKVVSAWVALPLFA
jgi:hypothetical protein